MVELDNTETAGTPARQQRIDLPPYETHRADAARRRARCVSGGRQGIHEAGILPNWIAGISIGALNTAIIAGNAPEHRVAHLQEFWDTICQSAFGFPLPAFVERSLFDSNDEIRKAFTTYQAASAIVEGQKSFFVPRVPPPSPIASSSPQTASYYDTTPLKATLERLCDFDRINSGETRVSVGAVNVATGNFAYFDNTRIALRAEHFIASGALPLGFAAVEIDGQFYWDGGLMSNTPLYEIAQATLRRDTLAFQVDLWSAKGPVPDSIVDVMSRMKDVQYLSRMRLSPIRCSARSAIATCCAMCWTCFPRTCARATNGAGSPNCSRARSTTTSSISFIATKSTKGTSRTISSAFRRCANTGRAGSTTSAARSRIATGSKCRTTNRVS